MHTASPQLPRGVGGVEQRPVAEVYCLLVLLLIWRRAIGIETTTPYANVSHSPAIIELQHRC